MVSFTDIPDESKLMLIGDWFQSPSGWKVVCYFQNQNKSYFRKPLPIDLLPALITGKTYPATSHTNNQTGYPGVFNLPDREQWQLLTYAEMPKSLQRAELLTQFEDQIAHQPIYRIDDGSYIYWLPVNELARMLFFHSAEIVRTAVLEGNTYQLAKAEQVNWLGRVTFKSHVPLNYINSLDYRRFFAWLLFDDTAQYSFGSILNDLNSESELRNAARCWTFNFVPPNIEGCNLTWAGYTGRKDEANHRYIREIRAISGVPTPELDSIEFEHPEDFINIEKDGEHDKEKSKNSPNSVVDPKNVNSGEDPKSKGKRYTIIIDKAGFHFETDLDMRRSPRFVRMLPKNEQSDLEEVEEDDTVGITQGTNTGKNARADIDNLDQPDPITPSEKLQRFEAMLETLCNENKWVLNYQRGDVPKKKCRSAHLVDKRPRQFCHACVNISSELSVYALEIELKEKETLSTLLYRAQSSQPLYDQILNDLMNSDSEKNHKAMQWKRKTLKKITASVHYLEHPDKKLLSEEEINESWSLRMRRKLSTL
jgi:hypothetical protein